MTIEAFFFRGCNVIRQILSGPGMSFACEPAFLRGNVWVR
jgi:hypothetical protein